MNVILIILHPFRKLTLLVHSFTLYYLLYSTKISKYIGREMLLFINILLHQNVNIC